MIEPQLFVRNVAVRVLHLREITGRSLTLLLCSGKGFIVHADILSRHTPNDLSTVKARLRSKRHGYSLRLNPQRSRFARALQALEIAGVTVFEYLRLKCDFLQLQLPNKLLQSIRFRRLASVGFGDLPWSNAA